MAVYELAIIGNCDAASRARLRATIGEMVADFGLNVGTDILIHDGESMLKRDRHAAFAATFFGGDQNVDAAGSGNHPQRQHAHRFYYCD